MRNKSAGNFCCALAMVVAGCGRTPLDLAMRDAGGADGALVDGGRDGGGRDGGLDAGRDGGFDAGRDTGLCLCASDADCDDGVFCNGVEVCRACACLPTMPPPCPDDGVECTRDVCSERIRACEHVPDPLACSPAERCDPRVGCVPSGCRSDAECRDARVCNGEERCVGGRCVPGAPRVCTDPDPCTIDRCDDAVGACVFTPDPACGACPDVDLGMRTGISVATGTTAGSHRSFEGSCGGRDAPEIALLWTVPTSGTWLIDTAGSRFDTLLHLRAGCDGAELPGMCNDDGIGMQSLLRLTARAGTRVLIVVDGFGSSSGDYVLNITMVTPPDAGVDGGTDAGTDAGPRDAGTDAMMCVAVETSVALCTNRRDDDCDSRFDCADPDCRPFGLMGECCNGVDDDGDGQIDIFTCRCNRDAQCATVGSLEQVCWTELFSVCAPRCNFYGGTAFCRDVDPGLVCNTTTGHCVPM